MHKAHVVSSFTKDGEGGNKAGVVFGKLDQNTMQSIAKELNFSETVFVDGNRFKYFTPVSEISFCGHATLAALHLMEYEEIDIQTNEFMIKAYKDPIPRFSTDDGLVIRKHIHIDKVLQSLGLKHKDLDVLGIKVVYAGLQDLFIHVKQLKRVKPNFELIAEVSKELDVVGYHVFSNHEKYDAATRNFAPLFGIDEESATGSASAALAYLLSLQNDKEKYVFLQGEAMNMSSEITILKDESLFISGEAVLIETRDVGGREDVEVK